MLGCWGGGLLHSPWGPFGLAHDFLTAQQLHTQGDAVMPGHRQDAHEASQEGCLEHVLLVGIIVHVAKEDLFIPVLGPVHTIVAEGHPVGCHVLDVAEVSGTLGDNASHLLLGAQVNL